MEGKKELDISQILVDYGVYNQSGINAMELDKKLRELFEQELDRTREEVITEIYNFVEGESGRSGRKEILEFISKLKDNK